MITYRDIPSINLLLNEIKPLKEPTYSLDIHKEILNKVIENIKTSISLGNKILKENLLVTIKENYDLLAKDYTSLNLKRIINCTGVINHTNLGRCPLREETLHHVKVVNSAYNNLEFDTEEKKRGSRYNHIKEYIQKLTGYEDSIIVNNNAAAVYLILNTLSKHKETIVSRGELVEIGGSFRIPAVMENAQVILKEVGSTNKTHIRDYIDNISENTNVVCKVHKSNYFIKGFVKELSIQEFGALEVPENIVKYYDMGSGSFIKLPGILMEEDIIQNCKLCGIDVISFSTDKLLGSTQGGIIAGSKEIIEKIKNNQMLRTFRIDKLSLSAIEYDLREYLLNINNPNHILFKLYNKNIETIKGNGQVILEVLSEKVISKYNVEIIPCHSMIGGGSLPEEYLDSYGISLKYTKEVENKLINRDIPIISSIKDDRLILNLRTILNDDLAILINFFKELNNEE